MDKRHKRYLSILSGSLVTFILFKSTIIIIAAIVSLITSPNEMYKDIDNYSNYLTELRANSDAHSKLFIFPDSIDAKNAEEFLYMKRDGLFDGSYVFYLVYNYDEAHYDSEIQRLESLVVPFDKYNSRNVPLHINDAYISIYDGIGTYEYALVDSEKHRVTYIFNQFYEYDELNIDSVDIFKDYQIKSGYNMYYHYFKSGDGIMFDELGD